MRTISLSAAARVLVATPAAACRTGDDDRPERRDEPRERLPKPGAHGAVQSEVDSVVDERDDVHGVA